MEAVAGQEHKYRHRGQSIARRDVKMARTRSAIARHRLFRLFSAHKVSEASMIWIVEACGSESGRENRERVKEALNELLMTGASRHSSSRNEWLLNTRDESSLFSDLAIPIAILNNLIILYEAARQTGHKDLLQSRSWVEGWVHVRCAIGLDRIIQISSGGKERYHAKR